MSWKSGSRLFKDVIKTIKRNIEDEHLRTLIYEELISSFEDMDCDTLGDCVGCDPAFDSAWEGLYGEE
jgi:hypothetical protein